MELMSKIDGPHTVGVDAVVTARWPAQRRSSGQSSRMTVSPSRWYRIIGRTSSTTNSIPSVIDPRGWQAKPILKREWLVEGLIPHRVVTLYSGDGGTGKTPTALQLIVAIAPRLQWFGKDVGAGPCLLYTAEDEADELHRRFAATVAKTGHELADLDGVRVIPMAGLDATLASSRQGQLNWTRQFHKLKAEIQQFKPRLVVIDPAADVFGGNEIDRAEVREFVQKLAGVALDHDCAVVLLSHPSLTGLNSGTGTSGSTAWSNSVRSRLYLQAAKDDPDRRALRG
jgi:RecA-family ATPase